MRRFIIIGVCAVLSGGLAAAADATLCPPMPCCVNQPASLNTSSEDCCGISADRGELPQNLTSKQTLDPQVRSIGLAPAVHGTPHVHSVTVESDASPPPSTRERLSSLSVLLI